MIIVESERILEFKIEDQDTVEECQWVAKTKDYQFVRRGAQVLIYLKNSRTLMGYFHVVDKSFFVIDPRAFELADLFGTKRFPVQAARLAFDEEKASQLNAIKFTRDRALTLSLDKDEKKIDAHVVQLEKILSLNQKDLTQFYEHLSELFMRCADFTPGKQEEYAAGLSDKFCRFNSENVTEQYFLLNENDEVIGTISATIFVNLKERIADVYFYDEVVNYFILLNENEKQKLAAYFQELDSYLKKVAANEKLNIESSKEKPEIERIKVNMAKITDLARMQLMKPLFQAARQNVNQSHLLTFQ